jgi:hypothetical protein
VDHKFWVNEITEMADKQFNGRAVVVYDHGYQQVDYAYPYAQPNRFYFNLLSGN